MPKNGDLLSMPAYTGLFHLFVSESIRHICKYIPSKSNQNFMLRRKGKLQRRVGCGMYDGWMHIQSGCQAVRRDTLTRLVVRLPCSYSKFIYLPAPSLFSPPHTTTFPSLILTTRQSVRDRALSHRAANLTVFVTCSRLWPVTPFVPSPPCFPSNHLRTGCQPQFPSSPCL